MNDAIRIRGAHEHNLKGVDVDVLHGSLTVITGVSGSGKSSLAFDTLYQEGQRRFMESLSPYARQFLGQMEKPKVDRVEGLSPTLCIDQKTVNRNPRSTVGTVTEIFDHLRLLWSRLGTPHCPICDRAIARRSPTDIADALLQTLEGQRLILLAPVVRDRKGEYRKELDTWRRDGWLRVRVNGELRSLEEEIPLERYEKHTLELVIDRLVVSRDDRARLVEGIERAVALAEGVCATLVGEVWTLHAVERACPDHAVSIPEMEPRLFSFNAPQGACSTCMGIGNVFADARGNLLPAPSDLDPARKRVCPVCAGRRLNPIALAVRFRGRNIAEVVAMSVQAAHSFFGGLELGDSEAAIGAGIVRELRERLRFLDEVGLGYLSLDRASNTLSGGEAQRIRLAACVGSGLVGVTYVLDEPSIGLHARDNARLIQALAALRDTGCTVVVVEHDRETMERADRIIDIGPGAGVNGGRLVAEGTPKAFSKLNTETARFLRDAERIELPTSRRLGSGAALRIRGATLHNLRAVNVDIPLGTLTVFTGVSGSGKSSLVFDVLKPALDLAIGGYDTPGLEGADAIDKVIEIDQAPIGRTPRSNPATYTGAFDLIRDLFAELPEAKARGWSKSRFTFNVAGGRCEDCEGAGLRTVEMSFLADVQVVCERCEGRRFNPETLEVLYRERSIADVLAMTITEAAAFFEHHKKLARIFSTMVRVGLGYVTLGQPASTLSGGEAQRVKLSTELHRVATGNTVYLLDEPTTGLHFSDVRLLIASLQALVEAGNTVVVIEHNTDLIKVADHVIELGPEGGAAGGKLLFAGTPEAMVGSDTPTGRVLGALPDMGGPPRVFAGGRRKGFVAGHADALVVRGARCHNLKGVDVSIPRGKTTVITGVSGSGKTSLAFDTIFAEGQRRYVESLSTYARRFLGRLDRAPVDSVEGLAPAIAIDQKVSAQTPRSTVATVTEIWDHMRLLWTHVGVPHCHKCGEAVRACAPGMAPERLGGLGRGRLVADLPKARKASDLRGEGYARAWVGGAEANLDELGHTPVSALVLDRFDPDAVERSRVIEAVALAYRLGSGRARFVHSGGERTFSERAACSTHGAVVPDPLTSRHFSFNHYLGACPACEGIGRKRTRAVWWKGDDDQRLLADHAPGAVCYVCQGARLRPESLAVKVSGQSIAAVAALSVADAEAFFRTLQLEGNDIAIAEPPLRELRGRLAFLLNVGLEYLTLDRRGDTLSGGEAQRIRLASQIGSGLTGCLYVLDEPTIGLHPRDTGRLLTTIEALRALGNTIIMVEHDPETIRRADHVVDLGPGAGEEGGYILAAGPPMSLGGGSLTGAFLRGERFIPVPSRRREPKAWLEVGPLTRHNLSGLVARFPTGCLTVVTGVSGSGKSTLVLEGLVPALEAMPKADRRRAPGTTTAARIELTVIDQAPIGRSPRSTPATYVGAWDAIRELFASTTLAKERAWAGGRFSFNAGAGACAHCGGHGSVQIEMHFLSDVWVKCDHCQGRRFDRATLDVRWKGLSIADVLELRVDAAAELFAAQRKISRGLRALADVGLGYLRLGQAATTLSGGEAQRIKLALGLMEKPGDSGRVYVLDEPTTGLHLADVETLVAVLDRLVDNGHTVVVIEHHVDVIRHADWVIDMGPEAGAAGGQILVAGSPTQVAAHPASHTGRALMARST
ncbi:UvrABC system protein A [Deltaproteobacteria bacterium]|nr:UvrABC system protein A [Deltaproteobacteria bacterium]